MERKTATDIAAAALLAQNDPHVDGVPVRVLRTISCWPHIHDLDECIRAGDLTLDSVARMMPGVPRPMVFYSVALLEDRGYLPHGTIR